MPYRFVLNDLFGAIVSSMTLLNTGFFSEFFLDFLLICFKDGLYNLRKNHYFNEVTDDGITSLHLLCKHTGILFF